MSSTENSEPIRLREHVAWILWCINQGYVLAEDRAILANWLLDDPSTLHPDDAKIRPGLLDMADEVLNAIDPSAFLIHRWLIERAASASPANEQTDVTPERDLIPKDAHG